jgi:hypothetical protein
MTSAVRIENARRLMADNAMRAIASIEQPFA